MKKSLQHAGIQEKDRACPAFPGWDFETSGNFKLRHPQKTGYNSSQPALTCHSLQSAPAASLTTYKDFIIPKVERWASQWLCFLGTSFSIPHPSMSLPENGHDCRIIYPSKT